MKQVLPCLVILLLGTDNFRVYARDEGQKPVVYDYVGKGADRRDEAVYRAVYGKKFRIVELTDSKASKGFELPKGILPKEPVRDSSGKILTGAVDVEFIVNQEGRIIEPFILRSAHPRLSEVALQAIEKTRAKPARLNGSPIAEMGAVTFVFEKPRLPKWLDDFPHAGATNARGVRYSLADHPPFLDDVTNRVVPENPSSTTRAGGAGHGLFRVSIDVKTGKVTDVVVLRPIESASLHPRVVAALRQWRWKPGTWRQVDIPFVYGPEGAAGSRDHDAISGSPKASPVYPGGLVP
jgi:TonB family protein